ncbi:MAG: methyltransferase domain-containing protein [Candidatus Omnitrophica bacterium]|nr:methyltransferase domain-containing protein [Candidatus Omnitrophota bacterium]
MSSIPVFYRNAVRHLKTTGSIAPSSRFLAKAMLQCLENRSHSLGIMEAGPGTGPFTKPLAAMLEDGDQLDLCELNDDFVAHLHGLLDVHPAMKARKDQITLYHQPVQMLEGEDRYDVIISGLPFNNFEPELVQDILDTYIKLLKPKGELTFFEYAGVRGMKRWIASNQENKRIDAVASVLQKFFKAYEKKRMLVLWNFPPATVHVCRMD